MEEQGPLESAFGWHWSQAQLSEKRKEESQVFDEEDRLEPLHPIFAIPPDAVSRCYDLFHPQGSQK